MKLLNKFLLGLVCAATICSSSALTPEQQERVNEQLRDAAEVGDLPAVQRALAAGADIHANNDYALRWAAYKGYLLVVQYLLEHGADIHARNDYALRWAAECGHWAVVHYLLKHGADIHADDDFALQLAAHNGHLAVVQYLLELPEGQRADIHADNDAALQLAASQGHLPLLQFLVEHGADIHARNDYALQLAAEGGHWAVVAYLLQHGANRAVLSAYQLNSLYEYICSELAAALSRDDWHKVEELLSTVAVHELPQDIQQKIRAILVPAVQKKLDSVPLVLFARTQITNPQLASRTLSFIVGPHTRAAFIYFIKEDTHEITQ